MYTHDTLLLIYKHCIQHCISVHYLSRLHWPYTEQIFTHTYIVICAQHPLVNNC